MLPLSDPLLLIMSVGGMSVGVYVLLRKSTRNTHFEVREPVNRNDKKDTHTPVSYRMGAASKNRNSSKCFPLQRFNLLVTF